MPTEMRAIGYFRESPAQKGETLGRQNRRFLDYCEAQGYEVAGTFSEEAKSSGAHAFSELLDFLKRPEKGFIVVVTPAPVTLADEPAAAAARCLQAERLGAQVQFIESSARDGDALSTILAGMANAQDDPVREKVQEALRRKAVRGEVLGRPPYGYRVGPKNRLELVDEEAVVVRYIYSLYLKDGLGIRLIARRLNEEGLRTRRSRPWSMVSIRDILRNRAYLGTYQRLGVRVPGTHPALVSPEDFRRVQERLEDRRTNYSPRSVGGFLLSGLARCGHCGNRMIGVSRKQAWIRRKDGSEQVANYRYYQCESRTNQGICSYHTHRADELEDSVRQELIEIDPRQLATAGDDAAVITHWQAESKRLRDRMQQIDRRLHRSLTTAVSEKTSREKVRSSAMVMAEERLKVEEELRDAQWRSEHYATAAERRRTRNAALELVTSKWDDLSLNDRQQLVRELVDHVKVSDEGVEVILKP